MHCPGCYSKNYVKNGFNSANHQMYCCKMCGRQFVLNPAKSPISDETKELIDRLLLERISLAGIARVTGVSERWLQSYVNQKYDQIAQQVDVKKPRPPDH